MKILHTIAFVLIIVGALNIGLTAVGYDILNMIFGTMPKITMTISILIGLSAILELVTHRSNCTNCKA